MENLQRFQQASLVELSREFGWIKARHVQQKFNGKLRPRPETIRDWFLELEVMGKGRTRGNNRTLEFFAFYDQTHAEELGSIKPQLSNK